jgi:E3 ubiquitin-protein ligase BAH
MSAVVGCFNEKAKKLLELHLASGFKKYAMWFTNRCHKGHGQLIQQGKDLVTYAIINAVAMRKILKKYDKVWALHSNSLAFSFEVVNTNI